MIPAACSDAPRIGPLDQRAQSDQEILTQWGGLGIGVLMDMGVVGSSTLPAGEQVDTLYLQGFQRIFRAARQICRERIDALQEAEQDDEVPEELLYQMKSNVDQEWLIAKLAQICEEMGLSSFSPEDITTREDAFKGIYVVCSELSQRITRHLRPLSPEEWGDLDTFFIRALVLLVDPSGTAPGGPASEDVDQTPLDRPPPC